MRHRMLSDCKQTTLGVYCQLPFTVRSNGYLLTSMCHVTLGEHDSTRCRGEQVFPCWNLAMPDMRLSVYSHFVITDPHCIVRLQYRHNRCRPNSYATASIMFAFSSRSSSSSTLFSIRHGTLLDLQNTGFASGSFRTLHCT